MQFIYFPISLFGCFLFYAWPWLVFSQFTSSSNYAKKAGNHSTVNQHESQGEEAITNTLRLELTECETKTKQK
jgi:hypothetical protein